jgi:hypothetical protein
MFCLSSKFCCLLKIYFLYKLYTTTHFLIDSLFLLQIRFWACYFRLFVVHCFMIIHFQKCLFFSFFTNNQNMCIVSSNQGKRNTKWLRICNSFPCFNNMLKNHSSPTTTVKLGYNELSEIGKIVRYNLVLQ